MPDPDAAHPGPAAPPAGRPVASVVIPAHDEAAVIGRTLRTLLAGAAPGELEIVVVCNACHDDTAAIASAFGPPVRVIDTEVPGKPNALNEGDGASTAFPRVYVDADIDLPIESLRRLVAALDADGVLAAVPTRVLDLADRPWAVRAYYRIWAEVPGVKGQVLGAGVYALSAAGRARFDAFPDVIGDDYFVASLFSPDERRTVEGATSVVRPPATMRDLVRVKTRAFAGNAQIHQQGSAGVVAGGGTPWWRQAVTDWRQAPSAAVYGGVTALAKVQARRRLRSGRPLRWERDERSRAGGTLS